MKTADGRADLAGVGVGAGFPVRVMGAINVSPESFYASSVAQTRRRLQRRAEQMIAEGAAVIDVGAMSTAPYRHGHIPEEEERRRVIAAVRWLREVAAVPISVDTQRSGVAGAALAAGAAIINDVSGLSADRKMVEVARDAGGLILMAREERASRQAPLVRVHALLRRALRRAASGGLCLDRIVLDPGIGFFRRAARPWYEVDCVLLARLGQLSALGRPLLVGPSRKSFIGRLTNRADPADRLHGTLAAVAIAVCNGAAVIRAHDVAPTVDAIRVAAAIRESAAPRRGRPAMLH